MSHAASIRTLVLAVSLTGLSATPAHAGTIIFDFEDGLQGWTLFGSAQRVQTQLLGGEWAISGDGQLSGSLGFVTDPIIVGSLTAEVFVAGGDASTLFLLAAADDLGLFVPFQVLQAGGPTIVSVQVDPRGGDFRGAFFRWEPEPSTEPPPGMVVFIDNITFHTIPEPSVLGMLVMGGVALAARRGGGWV